MNAREAILAARSHMGSCRESVEHDPDDLALWDGLTAAADRLEREAYAGDAERLAEASEWPKTLYRLIHWSDSDYAPEEETRMVDGSAIAKRLREADRLLGEARALLHQRIINVGEARRREGVKPAPVEVAPVIKSIDLFRGN